MVLLGHSQQAFRPTLDNLVGGIWSAIASLLTSMLLKINDLIMLIDNFSPDKAFQNVFECDNNLKSSIFVDHREHVPLLLNKFIHEAVPGHRLRDEI